MRSSPSHAPGAVIALVHDVLITAGLLALFGWEFDLNMVAVLLTLIGCRARGSAPTAHPRARGPRAVHP